MIEKILKFESIVLFLAAFYFYSMLDGNWLVFMLLLFTPDVSMLGYLIDKKIGSITYNLMHNYILSIVIFFAGVLIENILVSQLGIILFAHMSIDRFFGYGLKKTSGFKDTHLGKIGK